MNIFDSLEALLITNSTNIRYLTGFVGVAPEEREAYLLLTQDAIFLFTNALYLESTKNLKSQISMTKQGAITVIEISRENPLAKKLATILMSVIPGPTRNPSYLKTGSRLKGRDDKYGIKLGFEETDLTVAEFGKLKDELGGIRLIPTKNRIENLRMIKREDEIENIRQAAKITDECFDFIIGKIKPGVTESEIAWEIESFFRQRGAQTAFSPIVAFGKNSSMPHYRTSETRLRTSDIILLDFGARVNGYCSDMTRVVFVGKPKDEWKRAYEVVLKAQTVALNNIHNNPDKLSREVIKKAGFPPYPHSLGHGVGLAIHEQPRLSYKNPSARLRAGMVVAIEPAIYKEGRYGIRIEDLVLLKKDGVEILSKSPKKLLII
ncbi:aminopeptidase P family protein [Candidatus Gottesmanbacteria bacterium]|nr:aminopeptidase P family protein [Candidatus Gottesmanbacteria bacterium]